jgi:Methyltransferase domain
MRQERCQRMIGFIIQLITILVFPNLALADLIKEKDSEYLDLNHSSDAANANAKENYSTTNILPQFQLAFHESLGFFDNIHERNWRIKKKIAANRKHIVISHYREQVYYQYNWNPDFSCTETDSVIPMGSGGHYICDPWRLNKPGCVIYSIGTTSSQFGFRFEMALKHQLPLCDIHIFVNETKVTETANHETLTFHKLGSRGTNLQRYSSNRQQRKPTLSTLPDIVNSLGHSKIDLLLLDCQGCERDIFRDFGMIDFQQIILKVQGAEKPNKSKRQFVMNRITHMLEYLHHNLSYVIIHKEPDLMVGARNVEFSLLKLHSDFPTLEE